MAEKADTLACRLAERWRASRQQGEMWEAEPLQDECAPVRPLEGAKEAFVLSSYPCLCLTLVALADRGCEWWHGC